MVDLGMSPLRESFLLPGQLDQMEPFYPLKVFVCSECFLVQLEEYVNPTEIFDDYAYFSSYSTAWLAHARDFVDAMIERWRLGPRSIVVEVGSNDGYLLQFFVARRIPCLGIEPARSVAEAAINKGVPTRIEFFDEKSAARLVADPGQADLIVGNNVLAQVADLNGFVAGFPVLLAPGGVVTLEFPHVLRLMEGNQFDTIYHEHFSYFSLATSIRLFAHHGLTVFDVEELWTHGGSLRLFLKHANDDSKPISTEVSDLTHREREAGLLDLDAYSAFGRKAETTKHNLLAFLIRAKQEGRQVVAYGAPGKGNTLLNYCGMRTDFLDYVVDRNPYKHGRFTPGTHIPIHPSQRIAETRARLRDHPPLESARRDRRSARVRTGMGRPPGSTHPGTRGDRAVKVVLFCGGQGMRLRDYSEALPKPLIPIGPHPVLWHVMKYYAHFGHKDFILCLGYRAEAIKEYFLRYDEALANDFQLRSGGERQLMGSDISDWNISFVDTGVRSAIGERLRRAQPYLEGEELFLANYADGVTDLDLDDYVDRFKREGIPAGFLAVRPAQTHHVVTVNGDDRVSQIGPIGQTDIWLNGGGYFVFRDAIFDYIRPDEDLVSEPFARLIAERRLYAHRFHGFWSPMDTFKDKQYLDELFESGQAPWALWRNSNRSA
jgi:glucose-1-phosphate cytidylyltransferase